MNSDHDMTYKKPTVPNHPFRRRMLVSSIAAALGTTSVGFSYGAEIEEVVVTARQRAESSQDIPMMVQSISGEEMEKRGITTLEDYARFVAGLNISTTTPGQNTIVFRGVSDGGGFLVDPTAAIYLDEQPMSVTSAAPDVYPIDLARVEALAGPQSTLYGASSQSGAVRVITNKPDVTESSANVGFGVGQTRNGGSSHEVDATINVPLSDKVAIRLSGFKSEDAGYIDNVLGTTVYDDVFGTGLGGTKTNSGLEAEDVNNIEWQGGRAAIRWLVNDAWTVTGTANFQDLAAGGFNDYDPNIGDLKTVKFAEEFRTDEWLQTSLVIEGDLGFAQLVSATSYYDREIVYQHDTQSYAAYFHYAFGIYYGYQTYNFGEEPTGFLNQPYELDSFTQEFRLTGGSDRTNWTVGAFYQKSEEFWDFYTYIDGYRDSPAFEAWSYYYPGIAPTDAWWNSFQGTKRTDKAVFGEMDFDIIEDKLTALVGGRWYQVDRELSYTVEKPDSRVDQQLPNREAEDDGFIPKLGLEWHVNPDVMLYGVYSEGYRVGGTNRGRTNDNGGATLPVDYESDILENKELGLKSQFANGRVQLNAVLYQMNWADMQLEVIDPSNGLSAYGGDGNVPFQVVVGNVGDAVVKGWDFDLKALLGENVEIGFNMTKITQAYVEGQAFYDEPRVPGGQIPSGLEPRSSLPLFADKSWSAYVDLSGFDLLGASGNLRLQHNNVGESYNQLTGGFPSYKLSQGDYHVTDAIFSLETDGWSARIYVNNIADSRGISYEDTQDFDQIWGGNSSSVIRPRNFGVSFRKYL